MTDSEAAFAVTPYYQDDAVTIYHGDARTVLPKIGGDVMVTDPPYGIAWSPTSVSPQSRPIANDADTSHRDCVLDLWGDRPALVFGSPMRDTPRGTRQILVWRKGPDSGQTGGTLAGFRRDTEFIYLVGDWPRGEARGRSSVLATEDGHRAYTTKTGHPHTKPLPLMRELVAACPPGVIVDPFMGSGSTLRAAKELGRKAIGIEIDERWCAFAAQRMGQELLFPADGAA